MPRVPAPPPAGDAHRPWPPPRHRPFMLMRWLDLLFLHWPLLPDEVRPFIPPPMELDTRDGAAWLGVVPFRMAAVRPRVAPALPWLSAFAELNVRTYVTVGGKPGVWFFSLDAANPVAVRVARRAFYLPYYDARMRCAPEGDGVAYSSVRVHRRAPPARFVARYRPTGPVYRARPDTLEHWLTERYCLYSASPAGVVYRCEIAHPPWPLQPADCVVAANTMTEPLALALPAAPLVHFARRLDVRCWPLQPLSAASV